MNKQWVHIVTAGVIASGLLTAQAPPNIKARQERQDARIEKGKADGTLSNREARRLEARDKALDAKIRHDRKEGGGLTIQERKRIHELQNKQSKAIHRQRTDGNRK
jgi:hypothetical protein